MLKRIRTKIDNDLHLKELLRGGSIAFIMRIFGLIIGYGFTLFISRNYGAEAMGILSLALMVITVSVVVSKVGVDTALVRFIAEYSAQQQWSAVKGIYIKSIQLVLPFALLVSILLYYLSPYLAQSVFHKPQLMHYLQIASFSIVPIVFLTLNREVLRGMKYIGLYSFVNYIVVSLISLSILVILFYILPVDKGMPFYTYITANFIVSLCVMIILYLIIRQKLTERNTRERDAIGTKNLLSVAFPMFLTASMGLVMGATDTFMIGMYGTEVDLGVYAVAFKLAMITSISLMAVNSIAAPKFSELWSQNDFDKLERFAQQSTKIIFYTSVPILLLLVIFPKQVLGMFGDEFIIGSMALIILSMGQFINATSGSVGQFMNMTGNQKILQYTAMMATLINIIVNYVLIPKYGITGAAIATALSTSFWNLSCVYYIKYKYNILMLFIPSLKVGKV